MDQLLGAQAIPVVLAEEAHAGQPAGPLEAVEVVESSTAGRAPKFWLTVEVGGQPVDAATQDWG